MHIPLLKPQWDSSGQNYFRKFILKQNRNILLKIPPRLRHFQKFLLDKRENINSLCIEAQYIT